VGRGEKGRDVARFCKRAKGEKKNLWGGGGEREIIQGSRLIEPTDLPMRPPEKGNAGKENKRKKKMRVGGGRLSRTRGGERGSRGGGQKKTLVGGR